MSRFLQVRERLFDAPLLLTEQYASVIATAFADRLDVEPIVGKDVVDSYVKAPRAGLFDALGFEPLVEEPGMNLGYPRPGNSPVLDRSTCIAVYPVIGSMVHRGGGLMTSLSGVQSYTDIQADLTDMLNNPRVKGILLDLDTPGGEAAGITELASFMRDASASSGKPIWGLANTKACSGGYWLGAACTKLYAAPMAAVGSIGVVTMHTDVSKAMDKKGVVNTFVFAGAKKVDGHAFAPLSDGTKAEIQGRVDALYGQFVAAVADLRGIEPKSVRATEAGIFDPEHALKLGLIDGQADLGTTLAIMATAMNRTNPVPGAQLGSTNMLTQADVDAARAAGLREGHVAGTAEGHAAGLIAGRHEVSSSLSTLMPGNVAIEAFGDMLKDGMTASLAAKHAAKLVVPVTAPAVAATGATGAAAGATGATGSAPGVRTAGDVRTATQRDIDQRFTAETPNIANGGDQQLTAREQRMAEIKAAGSTFNNARGY